MRACRLGGISRAGWYRKSTARGQTALRMRIREIAMDRPRFGFQRIHIVLRREGTPPSYMDTHENRGAIRKANSTYGNRSSVPSGPKGKTYVKKSMLIARESVFNSDRPCVK